jgi:hypothetical protein
MLRGEKDLRDDDMGAVDTGDGHVLDLRAGEGELLKHTGRGNGEVDVVAEPAKREFHGRKREWVVCPRPSEWQGCGGARRGNFCLASLRAIG